MQCTLLARAGSAGLSIALALSVPGGTALAQAATAPRRPDLPLLRAPRILAAASDDFVLGELLAVRGGPPWHPRAVASTSGSRHLRRVGDEAFLVHPDAGLLERIPLDGSPPEVYDLGPSSEPRDVHVLGPDGPPRALVTRRHEPRLLLLDLATGVTTEATDLAPIAGGAPIALGTMIADRGRIFVQVRISSATPGGDAGALAVVDRTTLELIDADPDAPGLQGIALQGAPPQLRMQIVERTLFVSATEGALDGRGAIERVDLDELASIGFALSERQTADLGGFVMTSAEEGYFVFHTDFAASTHLSRFSIHGGPEPGPEIVVLLGDTIDNLAHDARNHRLYLPSGFAGGPVGIHVVDTQTDEPLSGGPIPTAQRVHDVIVR